MTEKRDPVQEAGEGEFDLYDVATWEERTFLDRASTRLYGTLVTGARASVVALAVLIVVAQFAAAAGLVYVNRPAVAVYVLLSVVPALGMAAYIWRADVTMQEPLELLVVTFAFGFLFAGFAAVLNSAFSGFFFQFTSDSPAWLAFLAPALYFFLVVGPVEETVKWLAVRLYAFRSDRFDAVVDGAVYGAMAGLGFATIENAIYIAREVIVVSQSAGNAVVADVALQTAAVRTLAGPGHVIYSAFAGYYLGLAKFNPENRGPIVVKGLVIASLIHATYNTSVTNLGAVADAIGLSQGVAFLAFVVAFDGFFFYVLYRKLTAYRDAYVETGASEAYDDEDELDEETGESDESAAVDGVDYSEGEETASETDAAASDDE
ncbi:PrsW family intramembrane metalloprotease [Halobacterium litoreum]|uniref:PrsW family intramembrane metalloprotease n=1 Tax=Halobacterium litoreum TaxID=2039234 RepID=A0ABD5NFP2_9EURY|nr:PrsW family intramembrane metalloprotease [Halobacterium litoreum]UHH13013.1 PrsW family intramembrane metalloprotease [Halobacterium litoreum]